jgi:hypothetical protein
MRTMLLAAICLLALSGCAQQHLAERKAAFDAAVAQCRTTTPARVGNEVPWARCVNAASEQFSPPSDRAVPLIRATRLSLAAKVDAVNYPRKMQEPSWLASLLKLDRSRRELAPLLRQVRGLL